MIFGETKITVIASYERTTLRAYHFFIPWPAPAGCIADAGCNKLKTPASQF